MNGTVSNPFTKSLSARVRYAAILLRRGDTRGALAVLEQCERCLPLPERINWQAAKAAARTKQKAAE